MIQKENAQELCDLILGSYGLNPIVNERQLYESEISYFKESKQDFIHEVRYNPIMDYALTRTLDKVELKSKKSRMKYMMKKDFQIHGKEIPHEWERMISKIKKDI